MIEKKLERNKKWFGSNGLNLNPDTAAYKSYPAHAPPEKRRRSLAGTLAHDGMMNG